MDIKKPQLVKVGAFDYFFSGRFCNTPTRGQADTTRCIPCYLVQLSCAKNIILVQLCRYKTVCLVQFYS